jgi:hypothetical protein
MQVRVVKELLAGPERATDPAYSGAGQCACEAALDIRSMVRLAMKTCMPCEAKSRASGFDRSLALCISLSSVCLVFCQRGSG